MDDDRKISPVDTGRDNLSIRPEDTAAQRPKQARPKPADDFKGVLRKKEMEIIEEESKKKAPHARYRNGKRIY